MKLRKIMRYAGMWVIKLYPMDIKDNNLQEEEMIDIESALMLHAQKKPQFSNPEPKIKKKLDSSQLNTQEVKKWQHKNR